MRTTALPPVLTFIIAVAVPALALGSIVLVGILGILTPLLVLVLMLGYRRITASTGSAWVREVGGFMMGGLLGWGFFAAAMILGVILGIVPFLSYDPHPYGDLWTFASVVAGVAAAAAAWWSLRRWALAGAAT